MALREILLQHVLLLLGAIILAASEPNSIFCNRTCGSLHVPYPFGTREGCYLNSSFLITCKDSKPFLGLSNESLEVLDVSLMEGEIRVSSHIVRDCPNEPRHNASKNIYQFPLLKYFLISYTKNRFFGVGCDTIGVIKAGALEDVDSSPFGCLSVCDRIDRIVNGSCEGIGCCQTSIPKEMSRFATNARAGLLLNDSAVGKFSPCGFSFVAEEKAYNFSSLDLVNLQNRRRTTAVVLDWAVGNETCRDANKTSTTYACKAENSECYNSTNGPGYRCECRSGYDGNPYLSNGCKDIDECEKNPNPCNKTCENINITGSFCNKICVNIAGSYECSCPKGYEGDDGRTNGTGCRPKFSQFRRIAIELGIGISFSILLVGGSWIYWGLKRRNLIKLKEKLFQQNGGLMLQQLLSNYKDSVERAKIFSTEELKKATNNYDKSMILGQGGNGIVYKGVLPGNKVVAIKKSKGFDQSQTKQFINEVLLLTQINHRNVVKLLGCCLNTEVPLLVYEFITNGTLFYHIHDKSHSSQLSWENRLKIAAETAGALAYLHSEASMPIIHRDVKTANILLDDNLTAKVADFGASRQISLDQAQVTTLVQGTFGYLDPEYFHTGQLTEKSDVYSFGVVLAELLTSKKAVLSNVIESDRNLSASFVSAVKEDHVLQTLDNHIINEGNIEELKEVANLVKRCLSVSGEDRPSMKEVAMELEGLRTMKKNPRGKPNLYTEETEYLLTEPAQSFSIDASTGCSSIYTTAGYDSIGNHLLKPPDGGR